MPSVLITGASRGIGYGFLKHYAAQPGTTAIGLVRNIPATEKRLAADNITNVHLVSADITDPVAIQAAADQTAKITGGGLDILINNAGLSGTDDSAFMPLAEMTPEQVKQYFTASFNANVIGVAITTNAFIPLIRKGATKKIITISTGMADAELVNEYRVTNATSYAISKSGTNMLVAKYHAALGESEGILFLAISPGVVDTSEGVPPTEEQMKGIQEMSAKFAKYAAKVAPDFKGPITAEFSASQVAGVVEKATVAENGGGFVSHWGNKTWL